LSFAPPLLYKEGGPDLSAEALVKVEERVRQILCRGVTCCAPFLWCFLTTAFKILAKKKRRYDQSSPCVQNRNRRIIKTLSTYLLIVTFICFTACGSSSSDTGTNALAGHTFTVDPDSDTPESISCISGCEYLSNATTIVFGSDNTIVIHYDNDTYNAGTWIYVDENSFDATFSIFSHAHSWDYTITGSTILLIVVYDD